MLFRENISAAREVREILIADIVLILAFTLTLSGGVFLASSSSFAKDFLYLLPITAIGVTLSFVLHELMHKFVAQHYGAIAGFRTSPNGLLITLLTGMFGFLLGIPGATVIYASSFTRKENGIVSLAGPLTNFAVFAVFLAVGIVLSPAQGSYIASMIGFVLFISILLAFFNMLPIFPLDGSKVLAWDRRIYLVTMVAIFILMVTFTGIPLYDIAFMVIIALFFSLFYRHVL
ncbi:MAG: site-2 protease family protein [Candidatus Marsarchaeota archaeon]|nr:site-2 protease family protein [Candidatus Marsarchaeota archaeon]